jgi:hypothetical protein
MQVYYVLMRNGNEYIGCFKKDEADEDEVDINLRQLFSPFQLVVTREGRQAAIPVPAKQLLLDLADVLTWGEATDEAAYNYHKQLDAMEAAKSGLMVPPTGIIAH